MMKRRMRKQGDRETGRQGDKETRSGRKTPSRWSKLSSIVFRKVSRYFLVSLSPCLLVSLSPGLPVSLSWLPSPTVSAQTAPIPTDRLVATVNGEVITQSDLVWQLALDPNVNPEAIAEKDLTRALRIQIDTLLLDQEARRLPGVKITDEEVTKLKGFFIRLFTSEVLLRQRLEAVGMDADTFDRLLRRKIQTDKYITFRFRSFVIVTDEEVLDFYKTRVRPAVQERGEVAPEEPTEEQRRQIVELLTLEKSDIEQLRWIQSARARADIVRLAPYAQPRQRAS